MTLLLPLFFGCDMTPPSQLEAFELVGEVSSELSEATISVSLLGTERDLLLTLENDEGQVSELEIHSPAASPFSTLEGLTVEISLLADWQGQYLLLQDADGLVYAGDAGPISDEVAAIFGREVVTRGARVHQVREDWTRWEFFEIDVHGDSGTLSLLPGDVEIVEIDGTPYRVTAIAAYDSGDSRPMLANKMCMGDDVFSYEIMRVDRDSHPETLERQADRLSPPGVCGDQPPE